MDKKNFTILKTERNQALIDGNVTVWFTALITEVTSSKYPETLQVSISDGAYQNLKKGDKIKVALSDLRFSCRGKDYKGTTFYRNTIKLLDTFEKEGLVIPAGLNAKGKSASTTTADTADGPICD